MNAYQGWSKLIGNKKRAAKLRMMLSRLPEAYYERELLVDRDGMPTAYIFQRVPMMCPTKLLYGEKESQKFYLDPEFRPALDAWDTGEIGPKELRAICNQLEGGNDAKKSRSHR